MAIQYAHAEVVVVQIRKPYIAPHVHRFEHVLVRKVLAKASNLGNRVKGKNGEGEGGSTILIQYCSTHAWHALPGGWGWAANFCFRLAVDSGMYTLRDRSLSFSE